jgi:hypothetical protein
MASPPHLRENGRGQTGTTRMLVRRVELKLLKLTAIPIPPDIMPLEKRAQQIKSFSGGNALVISASQDFYTYL